MPPPPPPGGEHSVPVAALPQLNSPWAALICMHTAFLTEHSTQAGKDEKKEREKETKSYFYGKLRSDCGAISQVHLNKSIKAYPNTKGKKKKAPTPSPTVPFRHLHLAVKTAARRLCECLSKAD